MAHAPDRSGPYDRAVSTPRDPLAATDRLLVDGSNLLPALARRGAQVPRAALIGRLRGAIPSTIGVELVFDGAPDPGLRGERIASGLIVRHAGRRTADDLLLSLVDQTAAAAGQGGVARLLVVTDDRALRTALHAKGARTAGTAWLLGRLERPTLASPSVGNRRPPKVAGPDQGGAELDDDREPWKPGRGATVKRGNPRRRRPSSGSMRS
jgi:YacP-like NYN domain